jgi:hypothetical protein
MCVFIHRGRRHAARCGPRASAVPLRSRYRAAGSADRKRRALAAPTNLPPPTDPCAPERCFEELANPMRVSTPEPMFYRFLAGWGVSAGPTPTPTPSDARRRMLPPRACRVPARRGATWIITHGCGTGSRGRDRVTRPIFRPRLGDRRRRGFGAQWRASVASHRSNKHGVSIEPRLPGRKPLISSPARTKRVSGARPSSLPASSNVAYGGRVAERGTPRTDGGRTSAGHGHTARESQRTWADARHAVIPPIAGSDRVFRLQNCPRRPLR